MSLGSPRQAVTFFEQALEVTTVDADRADLLERAGDAATDAGRPDLAEEILREAVDIRDRLGEPVAIARVAGMHAMALGSMRRRDESITAFERAIERLGDLEEHPIGIEMVGNFGRMLFLTQDYERAQRHADRALAAAERLNLARIATDALITKGFIATFAGRQWEARALLEGARSLATEHDFSDQALRTSVALSALSGLDDVRASVELGRAAIVLARRLGRRGDEVLSVGNASEDARRTGEWDWAISEIEAALQLDIDEGTRATLGLQRGLYDILRGQARIEDFGPLMAVTAGLQDVDVTAGFDEISAVAALVEGRFLEAYDHWMKVVGVSDLNTPYVLPRAALAAVLGRDPERAQAALDLLDARGTRGRAIDGDRMAIRAGIAGLNGDQAAAVAGYRAAMAAWRDLALPWDEALTALSAATVLDHGTHGLAEWIDGGRAILQRLGAAPMLVLLEQAASAHAGDATGGQTDAPSGSEPDAGARARRAPARVS